MLVNCTVPLTGFVSRAIQSVRLTGELSAEITAFSGQRGVAGQRTDRGSVPFILSKSEISANATLMLRGRTPAYSAPIVEVLRRGARRCDRRAQVRVGATLTAVVQAVRATIVPHVTLT